MIRSDEICAGLARIRPHRVRTSTYRSHALDRRVRGEVWLKAENRQRTGSFKFRGACNAVAATPPEERAEGLWTISSGNHGAALALAGKIFGAHVRVLVPDDAPAAKVDAIRRLGATVASFPRYGISQEKLAAELAAHTAGVYISAHDNRLVMAGAATAACELFADVRELDAVVIPVGGGGAIAGMGSYVRSHQPSCRVVGVEPVTASANRSLRAGRRLPAAVPRTIADGQTLAAPGALAFEIMQDVVDDIVLVDDEQIRRAMRFVHCSSGTMLEPSGATSVAAVLAGLVTGARIGVLLSGGNVDAQRFRQLTARWSPSPRPG